MANTALMMACDPASIVSTANTTQFWPVAGSVVANTTESNIQTIVRTPGTFHNLFVSITANSVNAPGVTFTFRESAANKNQTVTFAATTTGSAEDTTHTDVVVAANKIDIASVPGTTGTFSINIISSLFDSTTDFSTRQISTGSLADAIATQRVLQPGLIAATGSEAGRGDCQQPGTVTNLQCNVSTNAKTSTATCISRKNIANGALTTTIGIGATGMFEDTTHTDTIAATDTTLIAFPVGTDTTHVLTCTLAAKDFTTTIGNFFLNYCSANGDIVGTASTTKFAPLQGRLSFATTESTTQTQALESFLFSNLTTHVSTAPTVGVTVFFRKNTANGLETFTTTTGTGIFTDSTHTDTVLAGDLINRSYQFGATTQANFTAAQVWGSFTAAAVVLLNRSQLNTSFGELDPSDLLNINASMMFLGGTMSNFGGT